MEIGRNFRTLDPSWQRNEPRCICPTTAIGYAKFYSRSHDAVIRVYDAAGNVIETHEHAVEFREF
jgi:hypothetical protein